mgnify:CR=1 FL=1
MATKAVEIVVSGPDPRGIWHWRHHDGTEGYHEVPDELADADWTSGTVITARVESRPGGPVIVAIGDRTDVRIDGHSDGPNGAPPLLVNGEPFEVPLGSDLEVGMVVTAQVRFTNRSGSQDGGPVAKRRPAVVVDLESLTVSVRPVFSQNSEGRGQRLHDWKEAGLSHRSVVGHAEAIVSRHDVGEPIGRLSDADRRRLGL